MASNLIAMASNLKSTTPSEYIQISPMSHGLLGILVMNQRRFVAHLTFSEVQGYLAFCPLAVAASSGQPQTYQTPDVPVESSN